MKTLDAANQTAVDSQVRSTPYRILVEVVVGVTTYRWATGTLSFGGNSYEGRLSEVGQIHGLIVDGLRNTAAKRQFDFDVADKDHALAQQPTGYFHGAAVTVREIFDGVATEARHHNFQVERVLTQGRGHLRFECADNNPLTSDETIGEVVEAGDYTTAEEGLVGTNVKMIYGQRKIALKLISAEEGRFEVGYGLYSIDHLYQNGTELYAVGGPDGFDGFSVDVVGNRTTIVFNTPSQIRNVAVSGGPILPVTALVTRTDSYLGGAGEIGYGYARNNPINVFMDIWQMGDGDMTQPDLTTFSAAASGFFTDGVQFDCAIAGKRSAASLLQNLLLSCGGRIVVSDAVYFYRVGDEPISGLAFDTSNILRSKGNKDTTFTRTDISLDTIHNRGVLSFEKYDVLSEQSDPEVWRSTYEDATSIAALGVQERVESSFFIGDWDIADRAVQAMIRQEVAGLREYTFETTLQAMVVDEGDRVSVTWPDFGLAAQPCLVTNVQRLGGRRTQLTVQELASEIWVDPGPPPVQPPSVDPALIKPSSPTWTSIPLQQTFRVEADGTAVSDLTISWNAVTHPVLSGYEIWIGIDEPISVGSSGLPTDPDQLYATIPGTSRVIRGVLIGVTYYVRIRAITSNGLFSNLGAEQVITTQPKDDVYENVTGQGFAYTESGLSLYWNAPSADFKDFNYFEIAVSSGAGGYTVINHTDDHEITITYSRLEDLLPPGETIRDGYIYIRTVDRSFSRGSWSAIHFVNARPDAPTISTPSHGFLTIFLDSTPALDADVIRREWQVVDDSNYQLDGWAQATFFAAHHSTSAVFAGVDATLYHFRCRDIDWLADILGAADIALIPWSNEETDSTESVPSASVGFDTLASLTTKNHARNGGFERWPGTLPDFWVAFGGGDADQETTNPFSGSISAKVWGATGTQGGIYCDFTTSLPQFAGKNATVSFRYKTPAANPATAARVTVSTGVGDSGSLGDVTPSGTWGFKAFTFGIPSNATSLAINLYGDRNQTSLATLFDEVMVQVGEFVTTFELHDLDFLGDSGGIDETMIADDAITTPKLKANNVVAKHILTNQLAAKEIYAAADRVTVSSTVYKCKLTHGPGTPVIYDHGDHQPPNTTYWDVDAAADPTHFPAWVSGTKYFGGTVLADQIRATGAILETAHIKEVSADKLVSGEIKVGVSITSPDGSYWDNTGIHLGSGATISWSQVTDAPALSDDSTNLVRTPAFQGGDKGTWNEGTVETVTTTPSGFTKALKSTDRDNPANYWFPVQAGEKIYGVAEISAFYANFNCTLAMYCREADGTYHYLFLPYVPAGQSWTTVSGSFVVPANCVEARPFLQINGFSGWGYSLTTYAYFSRHAIGADVTADSTFVTSTYPADQAALQVQIDGKIETWFTSSDPSLSWSGTDASHAGDMWWNLTTKVLKRWSGSAWSEQITDPVATTAYADAATAQDTADGKRRVFTTTPSGPYDAGDLWDAGGTPRVLRRSTVTRASGYVSGDWIDVSTVGAKVGTNLLDSGGAAVTYLHSTYIDSTTVSAPTISGTTGRISGTLYVGLTSNGIKLDGSNGNIQSYTFISGSQGWRIQKDGSVEFNNGTFRGSLSGASISGATGTFSGSVSISGAAGSIQFNGSGSPYFFSIKDGSGNNIFNANDSNYAVAVGSSALGQGGILVTANHGGFSGISVNQYGASGDGVVSYVGGSYGYAVWARANATGAIALYGGAENSTAVPLYLKKSSTTGKHIIYGGPYYPGNPTGVVTANWGDMMLTNVGNVPTYYVCWGNGNPGAESSVGSNWRRLAYV